MVLIHGPFLQRQRGGPNGRSPEEPVQRARPGLESVRPLGLGTLLATAVEAPRTGARGVRKRRDPARRTSIPTGPRSPRRRLVRAAADRADLPGRPPGRAVRPVAPPGRRRPPLPPPAGT